MRRDKFATKPLALWLVLAGLLIAAGLVAAPEPDPERGPEGTLAFRRFLVEMGTQIEDSSDPPPPGEGTFLLLSDLRDTEQAEDLLEWVDSGGRLVVATASSEIAGVLNVGGFETVSIVGDVAGVDAGCAALLQAQIETVSVSTAGTAITRAPASYERCLPLESGSFMVAGSHGEGEVVLLGSPSPFTNRLLKRDDNALFVLRLLGKGPVVFGPPFEPSGLALPTNPWGALPSPARAVLIQIGLALLVFALIRGKRFGRTVDGEPVSPIPSSMLVSALGELYRSAGSSGYAGQILRKAAARRIARRVGVPVGTNSAGAIEAAERALEERGINTKALRGGDPGTDEELIALAQQLAELEESVVLN